MGQLIYMSIISGELALVTKRKSYTIWRFKSGWLFFEDQVNKELFCLIGRL
jgi:hypothetical protein